MLEPDVVAGITRSYAISATVMRKIRSPKKGLETLFGSYDENLKHLESLFDVRIRTQGTS